LAFSNAAISAANGVASVPAPNTISVPCAPDAAGLALPDVLELLVDVLEVLLEQAADTVTIRQAATASPPLQSLRPMTASFCTTTERAEPNRGHIPRGVIPAPGFTARCPDRAALVKSRVMTRYLQVSQEIASNIEAGLLGPGDELPSIRDAAGRYKTTGSTIARAYRYLADAGVIDVADRRRSRVAARGDVAARRLLGGHPVLRLAGSDDPGLDIVLRHSEACVVTVGARGSFHGLTRMWRGTADAAAIHLRHRSGGHNSPFARTLLRGRRPAIIHLWRREQGLLTPAGNPDHITEPGDLRTLQIARRPFGTGTRVLLDRLLTESGIAPASVTGPEAASHLEVAMSVASGQADTGLGVRAAATALDLGFIPLAWEDFDIVLSGDTLPAAEPLIAALRTPAVQSSIDALGGYDLSRAGSVEMLA
jgi:molybdate-binding protein